MAGIREFLNSPKGKAISATAIVIAVLLLGWSIWSNLSGDDAATSAGTFGFVDASTGKAFNYTIQAGDKIPVMAPSGKHSGYPAEMCWWTKDGTIKKVPTPVLLNEYAGKTGPTFCPDCGRLVVGHNPPAVPGMKPPPTEAEYKARNQN